VIGYFGLSTLKTPRLTRQLDRTQPYPHVASRSLLIRTGSGTADVVSVAVGAAEVTGDRVALRVTSAGKTRVDSGEIWTAKSAFFVRQPSVDFWFGALGNWLVSPCSDSNPFIRQPASS
jgi:hypothetical protein